MSRLWILPFVLLLSACTIVPIAAVNSFSEDHSCPESRIRLRRHAIEPSSVLIAVNPPAEVAADPARLAVWRANLLDDLEEHRSLAVVDVEGCGVRETSICWENYNTTTEEITVHCSEVDLSSPELQFEKFKLDDSTRRSLQAYFAGM